MLKLTMIRSLAAQSDPSVAPMSVIKNPTRLCEPPCLARGTARSYRASCKHVGDVVKIGLPKEPRSLCDSSVSDV